MAKGGSRKLRKGRTLANYFLFFLENYQKSYKISQEKGWSQSLWPKP